jgi:organic hydroperoxide reductase OsmC/OhrA
MARTVKRHEFEVAVDRARNARSALGGTALRPEREWWAEHLVLAGLVRCTLTSLDHHVRRAELHASGAGSAHGVVTKRADDGRYALVEVDVHLEVELTPAPAPETVRDLLARVQRGCFVGNSLTASPRYHWTVNGNEVLSA